MEKAVGAPKSVVEVKFAIFLIFARFFNVFPPGQLIFAVDDNALQGRPDSDCI